MNKPILIVAAKDLESDKHSFQGLEPEHIWLDRVSGGIFSQYLRNRSRVLKPEKLDLIWVHNTSKNFSEIFIWVGEGEFPWARLKQLLGDSSTYPAFWVGDFSAEDQKKLKKNFLNCEALKVPLPWSEDILDSQGSLRS
jgi:hypothetical protein